jgi:hypothetical protein
MRLNVSWLLPVAFLAAAPLAGAAAPSALQLAIDSQKVLNEYAIGAMDPEAMKYAQRLRRTQDALDAQARLWPAQSGAGDAWTPLRLCQVALQQASALAALSARKAVSASSEQDFLAGKARLQQLRSECDGLIRRAGK